MENVNQPNFASRFRELCTVSDQNILAERFGVTKNTFRQWTAGNSAPTLGKLIELSEYFGVSTDYLLGLSDTKSLDTSVQAACELTGLSEKAVVGLISLSDIEKHKDGIRVVSALSRLIEGKPGTVFLMCLGNSVEMARITLTEDADETKTDKLFPDSIAKKKRIALSKIKDNENPVKEILEIASEYEREQSINFMYMTRALQTFIKDEEEKAEAERTAADKQKRGTSNGKHT
jgi:transcriptional regulator with XRE-family HTH domain